MLARLAARRSSLMQARPPCTLLLHRNHGLPGPNPNPNLSTNPNYNDEAPMNLPAQVSSAATSELGYYGFDRPRTIAWSKDLWGRLDILGKLDQDVSLYYSSFGTPMAKSVFKVVEGNVLFTLEFRRDLALVAAAYLAKNDCILVSGGLRCSLNGSYWIIMAHDFKYVQTEHHNGHIPEGFVRKPRMKSLSEEGLQARWREFFQDPCQWQDNRAEKECQSRPDFEHKTFGYGLWVDGYQVPNWVKARLRQFDSTHDVNLNGDYGNASKDGNESCQQHGKLSQISARSVFSSKRSLEATITREKLWQDLFANPSTWHDCRRRKRTPKSPDFVHKNSDGALWICSWETPAWALHQLAIQDSNVQTARDIPRQKF